ncbi:MAG: Gfo/Idh/MocA family oxidoreductase [Acidobacteriaceae bacterium]|nr:Gfo/Idh/MocA family oxidoreductase [Acidobacteriaceae bacterium]MBV9441128.1 Gfo/Idh/MocA family oxidoreductase [Acidobacteriaceae bacterium]
MDKIRAAVVGTGAFGRNHARVISQLPDVELRALVDTDLSRAQNISEEYGGKPCTNLDAIVGEIDAAVISTPTITHEAIATTLLNSGLDLLVEKPIADSSAAGERLSRLARDNGRILQVGHLERFNPAVIALERALTVPLFFEVHRLSVFTPRSLDIDVVLDLMIHDLEIVLSFTRHLPQEVRAAGISVLSPKVDIANVRLAFASGCVANLTASRVSTEQVRKLRLFQPGEYVSVDYRRQDATRLAVDNGAIRFSPLPVEPAEPLFLELQAFFSSVRSRSAPKVDGLAASNALRVAEAILDKIKEHSELVASTVQRSR